jgi:hypothetical protein
MSNEALIVFFILAILALYELERIRKDTTLMRIMMEREASTWRVACKDISSIRHMLETEIMDGRERRVREAGR